ncbi:hypothetical protein DD238_007832 [Peronospora effusa]|uniref:PRORP domain-containing protein n=1 Tax=Peronospora effusa TaxID=542832 RepID=A0A3M6VE85_9STRA|nr:hypothetical protein DD238_007832 [Peronospora effusa]
MTFRSGGFNYGQIKHMVQHYETKGKKVLIVLHERRTSDKQVPIEYRAHIAEWRACHKMFNCQPGNNDDWYWLYAAVKLGGRTLMVSNDEMRDHHFQMIHNRAFGRWKERHQVHYQVHGHRVTVNEPLPYSERPQHIGDVWHFPSRKKRIITAESTAQVTDDKIHWLRRTVRERERERGRWSAPNVESSVDLDTLLEAPSPSKKEAARRRRKKRQSLSERFHRHTPHGHGRPAHGHGRPPRAPSFSDSNALARSRVHRSHTEAARRRAEDDMMPIYHSYEDPGYLAGDPIELQPFDTDCILGSPINSPSVIHARWGEPVDDPDEENLCTDFAPNPFKLGFCINCMKQHDVRDDGEVSTRKEYKRIARPTISKTAANALDLPSAIPIPRSSITMMPDGGRESDIDLAQLLAQRRDVLMRLDKLNRQEKTKLKKNQSTGRTMGRRTDRHTTINFGDNPRTNLRRMSTRPPGSGPIVSRGSTYAPQAPSGFGASKSVSAASRLYDDEEPAPNVWL